MGCSGAGTLYKGQKPIYKFFLLLAEGLVWFFLKHSEEDIEPVGQEGPGNEETGGFKWKRSAASSLHLLD